MHLSGSAGESRILVSETANPDPGYANRIYAFGSPAPDSFAELFAFGGTGSPPGRFDRAVALDSVEEVNGTTTSVVVADRGNERVQRVTATPENNGLVVWVSAAQDPGPPPRGGGNSPPLSNEPTGGPGVRINGGARYTRSPEVILSVDEPAGTTEVEIANNAGFVASQRFRSGLKQLDWRLDARDPDRVRRRVFVRFPGSDHGVESDEIRLDRGRPKVSSARIARGKSDWILRVVAADDGSGLSELLVGPERDGPFREISFEPRTTVASKKVARWVVVSDLVGNVSPPKRSGRRGR